MARTSKRGGKAKSTGRARRGRERRDDGWTNDYRGHGTTRDPSTYTTYRTDVVTDIEGISMVRSDDIIARIVELLPREATRRGFGLKIAAGDEGDAADGSKELAEDVMGEVERLNGTERIKVGGQWERMMGGSAIFPVLNGAVGELSEDLADYESGLVRIDALHMLEPRELRPASWYTDINHPKFRLPETYRLWPLAGASGTSIDTDVIHESRLIIFPGIKVSNQLQPGQRPGWGDSVIARCMRVVSDYGLAWGSAASLLHDFAQGVIKLSGLADMMSKAGGLAKLSRRATAMDMLRSSFRSVVIDKEDEFTRTSTPVSGLEGLLLQLAQRLAAAADMPLTILMGMSPAGLNATGEMDIRAWYDRVASLQAYYTEMAEKLIRLIMLQTDGPCNGVEPDGWSIEWKPLWQPSEKEQAETRYIIAQTDQIYEGMGSVTGEEVAESRWGGDSFSPDMHVNIAERKKQAELDTENLSDEDLAAMGRAPSGAAGGDNIQATVLNGAQIASMLDVVRAVVNREVPRESGVAALMKGYQMSQAEAEATLGPKDWEPPPPPPNPNTPPQLAPFTGEKPGAPVEEKSGTDTEVESEDKPENSPAPKPEPEPEE